MRSVIFDIDGTLYDYDAAHAHAISALETYFCAEYGLTPEAFKALHRQAEAVMRARAGAWSAAIHNRLLRYQVMLELLGRPIAGAPVLEALYWHTLLLWMKPYPGLHAALDAVHDMGMRVGVGTNMTADWQYEKLRVLKVLDKIDFIVTSEEAGCEKPDRRLFDLCAEKAGCAASDCVFVGDSLKGDVAGALGAGMRAIWFDPAGRDAQPPEGALRIASFDELPARLASL